MKTPIKKKTVVRELKNSQITASQIFLIKHNGDSAGLQNTRLALKSKDQSLDLIQVNPHSPAGQSIPTVREFLKKTLQPVKKETERKQNKSKIIEVHTGIDDHDLSIKIGRIQEFLEEDKRVRVQISVKKGTRVKSVCTRSVKEISLVIVSALKSFRNSTELENHHQIFLTFFPKISNTTSQ
jgi:translation initiation factor IF-3